MTNAELFQQIGIDTKKHNKGSIKTLCPKCSDSRKNKKDPCLSIDFEDGMYNCHNCDFHGRVFEKKIKEYVKPQPRLEKVSSKVISWFESRGISNNTLLRFKITESNEFMPQYDSNANCICFNYFRNDELVNIKFRDAKKAFKLSKDAELILYNIDAISDTDTCVIVEGEIDCLSLHEAGVFNSVSVPNGASKGSQKLEYVDNCWESFTDKKKVVIAVDNDEAGNSLKEELARRIGKAKCYTVTYPDGCKDANEVLMKYGKEAVAQMIESATEWPLEGIVSMDDMYSELQDIYLNGYPKGASARLGDFDKLLTFAPGQLTIITGMPGSGKDEFSNWIMTSLAKYEQWTWAVCGFEEPPVFHTSKLMEKFTNKSFDFRKNPNHRMSPQEFEYSAAMVDQYFHFINMDEVQANFDAILSKAQELVIKKGIKGLIINPWNCMDHKIPFGYNETQYVSEVLTKLIGFLKLNGVHCFLMAHPTKLAKDKKTGKYEVPTLYSISGSAHFFNKTHNGISVYRDFETGTVDVYVQKVKWSWLGKLGFCSYTFDTMTREYKPTGGVLPGWKPIED